MTKLPHVIHAQVHTRPAQEVAAHSVAHAEVSAAEVDDVHGPELHDDCRSKVRYGRISSSTATMSMLSGSTDSSRAFRIPANSSSE